MGEFGLFILTAIAEGEGVRSNLVLRTPFLLIILIQRVIAR